MDMNDFNYLQAGEGNCGETFGCLNGVRETVSEELNTISVNSVAKADDFSGINGGTASASVDYQTGDRRVGNICSPVSGNTMHLPRRGNANEDMQWKNQISDHRWRDSSILNGLSTSLLNDWEPPADIGLKSIGSEIWCWDTGIQSRNFGNGSSPTGMGTQDHTNCGTFSSDIIDLDWTPADHARTLVQGGSASSVESDTGGARVSNTVSKSASNRRKGGSNGLSDEALKLMDPKRVKRILANRLVITFQLC